MTRPERDAIIPAATPREKTVANKMSTATSKPAGAGDTCPECHLNSVESPFDYCSMCEMLTSYFNEKLATTAERHDPALFQTAYEKWRSLLTWTQIEEMRDHYWTARKRAKTRAAQ